jgi:peptidyl-Lys metalloendopeptidase
MTVRTSRFKIVQAKSPNVVSAAYDFSSLGAGEYTICPSGCLYIADGSGDIVPFSADTEHHIAKIAGTLARSTADQPTIEKRAKFIGCSSSQESEITSAILTATRYAKKAFKCVTLLSQ